jgi:hypothetical protein
MLWVHFSNSRRRFIRRNRRAVDSSSDDDEGGGAVAAVDRIVVGIDINDGMIGAWEDKGRVGVMTVIFILKPSTPIIIPLKSESIF